MNYLQRAILKIKKVVYKPRTPVTAPHELASLGTEYGAWSFLDTPNLRNSTIVSCGAGEDISFDIAFASNYNAKVILVDPTPRAITHIRDTLSRVGKPASEPFVSGGKQPVAAYDLSKLSPEQILHVSMALWNEKTTLKFYLPPNKDHVSHSIVNYQNDYSTDTDFVEVESTTILDLLANVKMPLKLMKLDIEGAEIEVISHMMESKIFPIQLLVEFDEMNHPSAKGKKRVENSYQLLIDRGYELVYFDGYANFCFVLSSFLKDHKNELAE